MQLPSPVRLLGVDLGITSDHTAVVVDDAGSICARRRARSTVASLAALEAAALDGAALGTQLVVVIEPTGPAWLPVAVFYGRRGHTVLRVTSAKAADLRRFLARHAKSNSIDAETLALAGAGPYQELTRAAGNGSGLAFVLRSKGGVFGFCSQRREP